MDNVTLILGEIRWNKEEAERQPSYQKKLQGCCEKFQLGAVWVEPGVWSAAPITQLNLHFPG